MKKIFALIIIYHLLCSAACSFGFSGSSLSADIKTCQISQFPNYSSLQNGSLSQDFTLALQDRFDQRTKLNIINKQADINIEGEIKNYSITSENTSSTDQNLQNKLTISIAVRYDNQVEPEKSFDKTFSDFENFDANDIQPDQDVVDDVTERLIDQIFNAIVSDW